ncbi:hypothetical protein PR202_ga04688 [Eleusine coracana subsp. coracana]|uniref:LOB domain-containing protein n=1 Tax=Eleusine coracana subsp. coracana TaxID=191504 RepID=A0AAV5BS75_ELECO|nr:hypothetical protein QOZ80_5AG0373030 [Eleusine coracana subsp. coracana]GJM88609.1 hypothetical protein PR202_ga04688 [Eleusine coracana subsp. coracana]
MASSRTSASSVPPVSTGSVITVASSPTTGTGTGSPCAACKFLRRKCQPDCVFAPYFPPENPQKFVHVHRVFGASNVTKILNDLHPYQREDAVNSLAYEADMRLRDPVYGCVGVISVLQHRLRLLQQELARTRFDLAKYQAAAEAAAAAAGSNGSGAPVSMVDFVDNPMMPNCTQNFINMGQQSTVTAIGGAGFMQHDHQFQMLARNYDGNNNEATTTTRLGVNGSGGYGFGYSSSVMGGADHSGLAGSIITSGPFFKSGTIGGDERSTAAQ